MSEEKFDAKLEQVKGTVKAGLGKLTGDKETETEGKVEKTVGKVKEKVADAKDTIKGAIDGLSDDDEEARIEVHSPEFEEISEDAKNQAQVEREHLKWTEPLVK